MMDDEALDPEQKNPSYAGRWVARVHGKIIAQGGTPEQALRASRLGRYKQKPEIIFVPTSFPLHPLIEKIKSIIPIDQPIHLVGGAVRDMLLGRLPADLDFASPSNCIPLARKVADSLHADFIVLDEQRDTGRVIVKDQEGIRTFLDFAAYRGLTLQDDLRGRDFTINALAYDLLAGTIMDPLEGAQDIRSKFIRACSATSFSDDPVRILRAVRLAAGFGFRIEKETRELMKRSAESLPQGSPERLRDELFKILDGLKPDASLRALEMLGVLPYFLPELVPMKGLDQSWPHVYDVWSHTLSVLGYLEDILAALHSGYTAEQTNDMLIGLLTLRLGRYRQQFAHHFASSLNMDRSLKSLLFFAALFHDVSKADTKSVEEDSRIRFFDHEIKGAIATEARARIFNLSNDEIDRLKKIIRNHMWFHFHASRYQGEKKEPSRKAIYRFFRDSGEAGVDLILLALADVRGTWGNTLKQETWLAYLDLARILLENYWEKPEEIVYPPRLVDGHDLMNELGLKPGPFVGQLLEAIRENQAAGKIENRNQALSFAREEIAKGAAGES
jgi:poly(A) polymerase